MFRPLVVLLVLIALVLAGCGGAAAPTAAPPAEQPVVEQPAATDPRLRRLQPSRLPSLLSSLLPRNLLPNRPRWIPNITRRRCWPRWSRPVSCLWLMSVCLLEPLVEEVATVGAYGGLLRRGFLGPSDHNNYTRLTYDALVRFSYGRQRGHSPHRQGLGVQR